MTYWDRFIDTLVKQVAWSNETFGPGRRTLGLTQHIALELDEIKAEPDDLEEWVDVLILAFDGARRTGHKPMEVLEAYIAKMNKNFNRTWPDYRLSDNSEDHAFMHIKETP